MNLNKILLTMSILLVIIGCKKLEFPDEDSKKVIGSWRYVNSSSILNGESVNGLNANHWIEFNNEGMYRLYENSTELEKSKFRFEKRKSYYGGEKMMIIYQTGSSRVHSFTFSGDTLRLYDEYYDGFEFTYVKK